MHSRRSAPNGYDQDRLGLAMVEKPTGSAAPRAITQSMSAQFTKQKPVEWIASLIQRYQDQVTDKITSAGTQLPFLTGRSIDQETRDLLNTTHSCIINVSKEHLHLVLLALLRVLKAVNASTHIQRLSSPIHLTQSRLIVLDTLLACLREVQ